MTLRLDPLIGGCGLALNGALSMAGRGTRSAPADQTVSGREIAPGPAKTGAAGSDGRGAGDSNWVGGRPPTHGLPDAGDFRGWSTGRRRVDSCHEDCPARGLVCFIGRQRQPAPQTLVLRVALAQSSGAPMHDAVSAFLADGRAAQRGKVLEQVRRLPVALMVPLGLLILPGFVVLFVGPIVLTSLQDLSRSLP